MPTPISSIPNLGPATEAAFGGIGIISAEQLRDLGADAAYLRLLDAGSQPHFIGYYAIVMGLQGRPWSDCQGAEKAALRKRFDALKKQVVKKGHSEREAALNFLGVIDRPREPSQNFSSKNFGSDPRKTAVPDQPTSSSPAKK